MQHGGRLPAHYPLGTARSRKIRAPSKSSSNSACLPQGVRNRGTPYFQCVTSPTIVRLKLHSVLPAGADSPFGSVVIMTLLATLSARSPRPRTRSSRAAEQRTWGNRPVTQRMRISGTPPLLMCGRGGFAVTGPNASSGGGGTRGPASGRPDRNDSTSLHRTLAARRTERDEGDPHGGRPVSPARTSRTLARHHTSGAAQ